MSIKRRRILRIVAILAIGVAVTARWSFSGGPWATLKGHDGPIYAVAFSTDGKLLASVGGDRVVRIWDVTTGRERAAMTSHDGFPMYVAFSPDGKLLATSDDQGVRTWDVATGRSTMVLTKAELPAWAAWKWPLSPDGRTRAEVNRPYPHRTMTLSDAETGQKLVTIEAHPDQLNAWAFSPDNLLLATGGGFTDHPWPVNRAGDTRIWDVKTGRLLATLRQHWGAVRDVKFSPNGKLLATASYDGTIKLWDVARVLGR